MKIWRIVVACLSVTVIILMGGGYAHSKYKSPVDMGSWGRVGSGLELVSADTTICVMRSAELDYSWPLDDVIYQWNQNNLNKFTLSVEAVNCSGYVIVTNSDSRDWWGSTEFIGRNIINVQLSRFTPNNYRHTVSCHEFGHVLGLPHSSGSGSCMDPHENNQNPTQQDLTTVGSILWKASVAANGIN